ncbi:MAG: YmdB family metallophosphoesterase [Mycoplasma sp.]|nr:YmdB family metallophosphoesterase [Mycoplasma sp.]
MKVLFLGDIFGTPGVKATISELPKLKQKFKPDFIIVQGENISGRKGLETKEYKLLKKAGVNAFTMGNHVFAKSDILNLFKFKDIIRPYNVKKNVPGFGSLLFKVNNKMLRVSSFMGIAFNELYKPWKQKYAYNFFDSFDELDKINKADYHFIDFHAETTSEKSVFGLYVDGKVNAIVGTHTHIQTSDNKTLPKGTAFITDVGMNGPINSAIGADYLSVYKKMRYDEMSKFTVSKNKCRINAVLINMCKRKNTIKRINYEVI